MTSVGYDFSQICRHCEKETVSPIECSIEGTVPSWIDGCFVFNGPGLTKVGKKEYNHCFDSASILQKITLSKGGVSSYMSRFQNTETFKKNQEAGTIVVGEFGTAPEIVDKGGFFSKLRKMADVENVISDNSVVSVEHVGGKYYTTGETPYLHELDLETLQNKSRMCLYKSCSLVTMSPHPVKDAEGHAYSVGQGVSMMGPKYSIVKFDKDGSAPSVVARVQPRWRMSPCYMHSLGITDNYLVMVEAPLSVSLSNILTDVIHNIAFLDAMRWQEDSVHILVVDLKTMKVLKKKFVMDTLFLLHLCNCFEDESGNIVMDFPRYKDATMLHDMFIENLRSQRGAKNKEFCERFITKYTRVTLPLDDTDTRTEIPVEGNVVNEEACLENPVINPSYQRRRHRFVYGIGISKDMKNRGQITKLDMDTGKLTVFAEDKLYTAESIFLPTPGGTEEDDGLLVTFCVVSDSPKLGYLVFLAAKTMTQVARVSFKPDSTVPMPMHGTYIPSGAQ